MLSRFRITSIAISVVGLACLGCKSEDDQKEQVSNNPKIEFKGSVDASLAATWKSDDGRSTMILNADGTSSMKSVVPTPGGAKSVDTKGKWLKDGDALLFQKSPTDTTRYFFTKEGNDKLIMRPLKDSKIKVVYIRSATK